MEPKKYRKKPVEIEAMQWDGSLTSAQEVAKWCGGRVEYDPKPSDPSDIYVSILIPTLEGTMRATRGDYVIRGVQGEFYPCKPDIFEATYDSTTRMVEVSTYGDRESRFVEVSDESVRNRL